MAACASYRVVKITPTGGQVALSGPFEKARARAISYIASVCPHGYEIPEEGEVDIGTNDSSYGSVNRSFGQPSVTTFGSTRTAHEWRITYVCKGAKAPPAAGTSGAIEQRHVTFRF